MTLEFYCVVGQCLVTKDIKTVDGTAGFRTVILKESLSIFNIVSKSLHKFFLASQSVWEVFMASKSKVVEKG
jgi:hypothetical protein